MPVCNSLYNIFSQPYVIQDAEELRMNLRMFHPQFYMFDTSQMQDMEEFLLALMAAIKIETKDETFLEKYCTGSIFNTPTFVDSGVCPNCQKHHPQDEQIFSVLNVNIPQNSKDGLSLESIIDKAMTTPTIRDQKCPNCDHYGQVIEHKTLTKAPEILCVKLLRYDSNQVKDRTFIVPENVIQLQDRTVKYKLTSIIDHKGSTIQGGQWVVHKKYQNIILNQLKVPQLRIFFT